MIRKLRTEAGLTQKRLAGLVGVSQAHIAKIEQGRVDPRLSTVNRVMQVLGNSKKKCRDIMSRDVITAHLKDKIPAISDKMVKNAISQIPILDGEIVVGTVTEESIMRRLNTGVDNQMAKIAMVAPLPQVDEEASIEDVRRLLRTHQGVLVSRGKRIVGIVTRSDLLKVISEPI